MSFALTSLSALAAFGAVLPVAQAHMAMWHPSAYGFNHGYEPATPLANKGFNDWWFHGYANERPNQVMDITAGRDVTVEVACNKGYTSWGGQSSGDACPGDAGSYHAGGSTGSGSGWGGNSENNLFGCALAIAYKPNANQVRPEDFIVMSVQENCVRQRDTTFSIPANLPECPDGECTCAWFWQGKMSADEMYMNGFRCRVQNGVVGASIPRPEAPRRGQRITRATQPMYWANSNSNLDFTPSWETKPSYNSAWGWVNGAQTSAFGAGSGNGGGSSPSTTSRGGNGGNGGGSPSTTTSRGSNGNGGNGGGSPSTTSSRGAQPTGGQGGQSGPEFPNYAAQPTVPDTDDDIPKTSSAPSATPTTGGGAKPCKGKRRRSRVRKVHNKKRQTAH